ncbi:AraC family transcriptional regulator [Pandoraea pulmonicola]|uniref:AraC family transcriptional regulator n=2 Tax=Pandoraea pulmonicola TaxID=93221 RepID=A0ABM5S686_PANPU|nr:AraC family transcriptional regulator [Pandoraea pulmonicola]
MTSCPTSSSMDFTPCPDRFARAPRVPEHGPLLSTHLHPPSAALHGALAAVVTRDTRSAGLSDTQRLSHFPASPLVCLTIYQGFDVGLVRTSDGVSRWSAFGTRATLSGSQSLPTTSWAPRDGRGVLICLPVSVVKPLLGVDPLALQDRFVCAYDAMGDDWRPFLDALVAAQDDTTSLAVLDTFLGPRWTSVRPERTPLGALRLAGQRWVEGLAFQALEWRRTHSPRQVERRIKAHTGRSLREWQALVKTESAFFSARDSFESGQPFDWAALAHDEGFADQAHMSRMSKRVTGFSPGEFARRYLEDESFWLYRLWV